jgi:hypothetical protein
LTEEDRADGINGDYYGEDYIFCDWVRSLGEKIYCDPNLAITHTGTKDYMGHLGDFLCRMDAERKAPKVELSEQHKEALAQLFSNEKYQRLFDAIAA